MSDRTVAGRPDAETTGLDRRKDEIIEIALIAFSFNGEGDIGDVADLGGGRKARGAPSRPWTTSGESTRGNGARGRYVHPPWKVIPSRHGSQHPNSSVDQTSEMAQRSRVVFQRSDTSTNAANLLRTYRILVKISKFSALRLQIPERRVSWIMSVASTWDDHVIEEMRTAASLSS